MDKPKAQTKAQTMPQPQVQEFPAGSYVNFLRVAHGNSEASECPEVQLDETLTTDPGVHVVQMKPLDPVEIEDAPRWRLGRSACSDQRSE